MKDMALHLEKAYAFQQKLVSQFIYPIIILHAAVFIPQIPTLVTGSIAGYLQSTLGALLPMYGAALGALIFFRLAGQSSAPRLAVDSLLLKLPFLGKIVATFSLMRFFRALCELYEAGLPISAAVEAASGACGNSLAARRLRKCLPALDSGMGFTDALRTTKMVPMMALQMMGAAETAGSLGTVLGKTADYLELEGEEALKRLAAVLPVLIYVLMGAYVGYVAIRFYIGYSNSIFSIVP
jgi:type II secretory pathway component PulF